MSKFFVFFMIAIGVTSPVHAEITITDIWNTDGSSKIQPKDLTKSQNTMTYEWERENAEYILRNLGKKCSELVDIPEYTRLFAFRSFTIPPKKYGPEDICFSSDSLRQIYSTLGEHEKWLNSEQAYYQSRPDSHSPYAMEEYLNALLSAGHYREAEKFFPEFVSAVYPWLTREEVVEKLRKGQGVPEALSETIIAEPWNKILKTKGVPDDFKKLDPAESLYEPVEKMHRYFYSKDAKKRGEALQYYYDNGIDFMLKKASNKWSGDLKAKAKAYLLELKKHR